MKQLFDFSGFEKNEEIIKNTWAEFRDLLASGKFKYDDIPAALQTTFLHVFDDLFHHCYTFVEKSVENTFNSETRLTRAAKIDRDAPIPTYSRFIPDSKYITESNRFSPPGVEWLYLAFSNGAVSKDCPLEEKCALRECRANAGDRFALCSFKVKSQYKDKKIIDLTIAKESKFKEINDELEQRATSLYIKESNKIHTIAVKKGIILKPHMEGLIPLIEKWTIYTYMRLLSEQIFLPLTTGNKELMYAPFQCMAQYFLRMGYCGIVYSSTVFPAGNNVVFFDKNIALPYGTVKIIDIPAYF